MSTIAEAFDFVEPALLREKTRDDDPLSLGSASREDLRRMVYSVWKTYPHVSWEDAEESTGDALVYLLERKPEFDPTRGTCGGLVVQKARWLLQKAFTERRRVQSVQGLYASSGDRAFFGARPIRPDSPTMHPGLTDVQRRHAERLIAWHAREGRSPTAVECEACPELPSSGTLRNHFKTFNGALAAAGLPIGHHRRRTWTKDEAIDVLLRHRRMAGTFPSSQEILDGEHFPSAKSMFRFFGSTSPRKYGPKVLAAAEALEQR